MEALQKVSNEIREFNLLSDWEKLVEAFLLHSAVTNPNKFKERTRRTYAQILESDEQRKSKGRKSWKQYDVLKDPAPCFHTFLLDNNIKAPGILDLSGYKELLQSAYALSVSTINLYLIAIKRFLKFLDDTGAYHNTAHQVKTIKRTNLDHKREDIPTAWLSKIINSIDRKAIKGKRDLSIVILGALCGMRVNEIINLDRKDIKQNGPVMELAVMGKGRTEQDSIFTDDPNVIKAIVDYLKALDAIGLGKGAIFISFEKNSYGGRLSTASIRGMFKRLLSNIDIAPEIRSKFSFHSLRHGFITRQIEAKVDPRTVQVRARHKSLDTTMGYFHEHNNKRAWDGMGQALKEYSQLLGETNGTTTTPIENA